MSNYSKTTDFAAKDSLPSGDSGKIIRGSEFETEFDNISTAIATKADAADPTFTGTVTIDGLTVNGNTTLGNAATDTVTVTADIASNLIPSADDTYNLGASGAEWNDLFIDGTANIDSLVADTADINGGTIDGVTIGGSSAGAITGTTITGTSFVTSGNMTFGDNDKAIFGTGSDLQIYHDGVHSYIADVGAGVLFLRGESNIVLENNSGSNYFEGTSNGASTIYYAGNAKLATTSTGVDVTGTVTADGLIFDQSYANPTGSTATIYNQSFVGPTLSGLKNQFRTGTTPVERMRIESNGDISFYEDTGTTAKFFWDASAESLGIGTSSPQAGITVKVDSPFSKTADDFSGDGLYIQTDTTSAEGYSGGISFSRRQLNGKRAAGIAGVQTGSDADEFGLAFFTHASTAEALDLIEAMRIDSSGNVGIGTDSPARPLTVNGLIGSRNSTTGFGASDGFDIGVGGSDAYLVQRENADIIIETNGSERMRIDSNGRVGIGTASPAVPLHVQADGTGLRLQGVSPDTNGAILDFYNSSGSRRGLVGFVGAGTTMVVSNDESGALAFQTANTERMRVTTDGVLLVGKSGEGFTATGHELHEDGLLVSTRSGATVAALNRETNDGSILQFRKDNSTVGSIGSYAGNTYFAGSAVGLRPRTVDIIPVDTTGAVSDADISLGEAGARFEDLFLSGGISFNPNAAENKLDDYEEGGFTVAVEGSTTAGTGTYATRNARYTKIGNVVHVRMYINMSAHTGAGNLLITGLPFNAKNSANEFFTASIDFSNGISKTADNYIYGLLRPNTSQIEVQRQPVSGTSTAWNLYVPLDTSFQAALNLTYTTN